jgi:hypothetical protein
MVSRILTTTQGQAQGSWIVLCVMMLFTTTPSSAMQLSDVEWKKRPLLLFAPNHHSVRLQQTQYRLQQNSCELEDRDMFVAVIVGQGHSAMDKQPISLQYASSLRKQFAISSDQFVVILLGKDGGEKYRSYQIPDLDKIFALIDGMPMRQDEIQENPVNCRKQS